MPVALHGELFEHLALVGPGFDVQKEERRLQGVALFRRHRAIESIAVADGIVDFVFGALPVHVECGIELLKDVR